VPTSPTSTRKTNRGPAAGPDNRRALIAAAREVYAESGLSAPFSAVARRAGVGQGSLYRHFPDRTALAVAVFEENVSDLERYTAPEGRTIEDLLDRVVDQAVVSTALLDLITADLHDPRVVPLGERFRDLVVRLVEREHREGHIGDHVEPEDVMMATGMLATELSRTDPELRTVVAMRARAIFRAAFSPR